MKRSGIGTADLVHPDALTPCLMRQCLFGLSSLDELPELPRYKLDENEQIVIDDLEIDENKENEEIDENE